MDHWMKLLLLLFVISSVSPTPHHPRNKRSVFHNPIFSSVFHNANPSTSFTERFFQGSRHGDWYRPHYYPEYTPHIITSSEQTPVSTAIAGDADTDVVEASRSNTALGYVGVYKVHGVSDEYGLPKTKSLQTDYPQLPVTTHQVTSSPVYGLPKVKTLEAPSNLHNYPEYPPYSLIAHDEAKRFPLAHNIREEYGLPKVKTLELESNPHYYPQYPPLSEPDHEEATGSPIINNIKNEYGLPKVKSLDIASNTYYSEYPPYLVKAQNEATSSPVNPDIREEYGLPKVKTLESWSENNHTTQPKISTEYGVPTQKSNKLFGNELSSSSFHHDSLNSDKISASKSLLLATERSVISGGATRSNQASFNNLKTLLLHRQHNNQHTKATTLNSQYVPQTYVNVPSSYKINVIQPSSEYGVPHEYVTEVNHKAHIERSLPRSQEAITPINPETIPYKSAQISTQSRLKPFGSYRERKKHRKVQYHEERTAPENYHIPPLGVLPGGIFGGPWESVAPEHGLPKTKPPRDFLEGSGKVRGNHSQNQEIRGFKIKPVPWYGPY
ncbi:uncharacterized protein LOC115881576 [Sitophilus oryzae]|uniref:Uncharacterized protein LOC115881576 n=1 Tax=Sitophilus oryzae TaxID=7048 RepID=A0A6J2XWI3_SITOR|nr:uncharacterized protein LOC115881576 [Sitophilus oryzae]